MAAVDGSLVHILPCGLFDCGCVCQAQDGPSEARERLWLPPLFNVGKEAVWELGPACLSVRILSLRVGDRGRSLGGCVGSGVRSNRKGGRF